MKSVFAFAGMFALILFGPMFLESRARRGRMGDGKGPAYDFLIYMLSHPEAQYLTCCLAVVAYNLYLVFKNTRKKYVVSLCLEDETMEIGLTNLYYKNTVIERIPVSDLSYTIESKTSKDNNEKKQTLKFLNRSNGTVIGLIKPKHFIWNENILMVKNALRELAYLGVQKE